MLMLVSLANRVKSARIYLSYCGARISFDERRMRMNDRRKFMTTIGAVLASTTLARNVEAQDKEAIAILGTGKLGAALGKLWAKKGHRIIYGSRTPGEARVRKIVDETGPRASAMSHAQATASEAKLVLFALPPQAVPTLVPTLEGLDGKVIMDPMNAFQMVDGYPQPSPGVQTSVAEQLQALLPNAHVVKAFNTPSVRNIVDPNRLDGPFTIPLAGADAGAKARVAQLVSELGLEAVDTGPLVASRYLEGMMRLSLGYFLYSKGTSFEFYLRPVRR
jgi:predicted dinucleotide-binding enzyme